MTDEIILQVKEFIILHGKGRLPPGVFGDVIYHGSDYSNCSIRNGRINVHYTRFPDGKIRVNSITQDLTKVGMMPRVWHQENHKRGTGVIYWNPLWQSISDADTYDFSFDTRERVTRTCNQNA